jgi:hypothetical protein
MDVYFSLDAYNHLKTHALVVNPSTTDGLIIGHRRGPAFFVESILPTSKGFFPSEEKYHSLRDLFHDKLIGFFTFFPDEKKAKKILAPFACGKLYLELSTDKSKRLRIKPFLIEYEERFLLSPLRFKKPPVKE